jgi:HAD superfamily hydrolase (TIGR01509 family)
MFEAVIFDWDGTLADTRKPILHSFHVALKEFVGTDVDDLTVDRLIGIGASKTFQEILRLKQIPFTEDLIRRLVARKIEAEIEVSNQTELFPGAIDLLEALQGKAKLAVASMKNRPIVEYLLDSTKIRKFFQTVVTVEDVAKPKPDPEIFLKAAQMLDCAAEHCVVVEDSVYGVTAAKAAGMNCIGVAQGFYSKAELKTARADLVLPSLLEKSAILMCVLG